MTVHVDVWWCAPMRITVLMPDYHCPFTNVEFGNMLYTCSHDLHCMPETGNVWVIQRPLQLSCKGNHYNACLPTRIALCGVISNFFCLFRENNLDKVITLIKGKVEEVTLPVERVGREMCRLYLRDCLEVIKTYRHD